MVGHATLQLPLLVSLKPFVTVLEWLHFRLVSNDDAWMGAVSFFLSAWKSAGRTSLCLLQCLVAQA